MTFSPLTTEERNVSFKTVFTTVPVHDILTVMSPISSLWFIESWYPLEGREWRREKEGEGRRGRGRGREGERGRERGREGKREGGGERRRKKGRRDREVE